ncbi:MAG: hypothetical protein DMG73_13830 [Acidobacteria bacterium]|nr:MAG: hypothetical protein DMG73_13830 [Acidobacteriota bacterium]
MVVSALRKFASVGICLSAFFLAAGAQGQAAATAADTVVVHAKIYTVNPEQPWAEALAISGDRILAVGTEKDIAPYRGEKTRVIDANGSLVLPGRNSQRDPEAGEGIRRGASPGIVDFRHGLVVPNLRAVRAT